MEPVIIVEDIGHQVDDDGDFLTSSPKERRSRRRKRGKSEREVLPGSLSPVRSVSESGANDGFDWFNLGASFITSGSGSVISDSGGNDYKKLRLDEDAEGLDESDEKIEDSSVSTASDTSQQSGAQVEGQDIGINSEIDLAAGKGEDSSQTDESSSGVTDAGVVLSPGSTGGKDDGGL